MHKTMAGWAEPSQPLLLRRRDYEVFFVFLWCCFAPGSWCAARDGLDWPLVDRGCGHRGGIGTCGNQDVVHLLGILGSGEDLDAGSIDALLLYQVVLGVDGALCGELRTILLAAAGVADYIEGSVRGALQVQCEVIEASLAFVVHAGRGAWYRGRS